MVAYLCRYYFARHRIQTVGKWKIRSCIFVLYLLKITFIYFILSLFSTTC